jgi:hypothetical protein
MIDAPPEPPCPPGVAPAATIHAEDRDDGNGSLTATHTIALRIGTAEGEVESTSVTLPPGIERRQAGPSPAFRADAPGPVPVAMTWLHFDRQTGSDCTAAVTTTLQISAAKPLRFVPPPRRIRQMNSLEWRVRVGADADLRPVEMRLRGSRRARLPRPGAPLRRLVSCCAAATAG